MERISSWNQQLTSRALDGLEHPRVVGTLAGDDTCLVIAQDTANAKSLARELSALMR